MSILAVMKGLRLSGKVLSREGAIVAVGSGDRSGQMQSDGGGQSRQKKAVLLLLKVLGNERVRCDSGDVENGSRHQRTLRAPSNESAHLHQRQELQAASAVCGRNRTDLLQLRPWYATNDCLGSNQ